MKISIIIPTYNRDYCIQRSIDSILAQTFTDYEIIVVDDGSSDHTEEIVKNYENTTDKIRYKKLSKNMGVANARNVGMKEALGDYIAFQDSDDYWFPEKLEKQMEAIRHHRADYSYTYIRYQFEDGSTVVIPNQNIPLTRMNGNIYPQMLHSNLVGAPTLLMKRKCYEEIGEFDTSLKALEDYDYALRLSSKFKAAFVEECLFEASLSEQGISTNASNHLIASSILIGRYKNSLLKYGEFDYQVEKLFHNAKSIGMEQQIMNFLEKVLATETGM